MLPLFAIIGLALGSFGNVLLHRITVQEPISGRSRCPLCHHPIAPYDLIPLLSYVFLRGACRHCHAAIPLRYPLIEAGSMALFILAARLFPSDPLFAYCTAVALYFLFLACVYDAMHQEIPDALTLLLGIVTIPIILQKGEPSSSFFGAAIAVVWFGGQWILSRGRAVGSGDILLALVLGMWLGMTETIAMLVMSYVVGALTALVLLALGILSRSSRTIAFGPFLGIGTLLSLLGIGEWYLGLILGR